MEEYHDIVRYVMYHGNLKRIRSNHYTLSSFAIPYKINVLEQFPLLTTKKISWKNIVIELLWFLSGKKDIKFLHKHGCHFWDPWAKNGIVDAGYGFFWRNFENFDQVKNIIDTLKKDPNSRRMVCSAWHPREAAKASLPPCHVMWILYHNNGKLSLHLTQRSADIAIGIPYNIASYSLLLCLICHLANMIPFEFASTMVDAHIYLGKEGLIYDKVSYDPDNPSYNHIPGLLEQLKRTPRDLPKLVISDDIKNLDDIKCIIEYAATKEILDLFKLENYNPYDNIKFKVFV